MVAGAEVQALICELCKGNSFSKLDDFFQCDFCRTKYSLEQAQKLMVEGTVTVDRSGEAENILMLAEKSLNHGNALEGHEGAKRVLEIDPKSSRGWLLLGVSRLALGVSARHRREARRDIELAFQHADDAERRDFEATVVEAIRQAITDEFWRMGMRDVTGALDPNRVLVPKNLAEIYELTDSNVELLKLAYALTSDTSFAKLVIQIADETLSRIQLPPKSDTSNRFVTQQQVDKMLADFEQSVEIVKFVEPKFKARAPKLGKKGFLLWP